MCKMSDKLGFKCRVRVHVRVGVVGADRPIAAVGRCIN